MQKSPQLLTSGRPMAALLHNGSTIACSTTFVNHHILTMADPQYLRAVQTGPGVMRLGPTTLTIHSQPIPEPGTGMLIGLGLVAELSTRMRAGDIGAGREHREKRRH